MNSFILFNKHVVAFLVFFRHSISSTDISCLPFLHFLDRFHLSVNKYAMSSWYVPGTESGSASSLLLLCLEDEDIGILSSADVLRTEA